MFGCFFDPLRFEPGERPLSPVDAAFKFASFFINAENGRRRAGLAARSGMSLVVLVWVSSQGAGPP